MKYQNPEILYFLFAIAIPIIIHFFNLRKYKSVFFTNIHFLESIKSQKKNRNRLKEILLLISRILAISALIFAFANPYIPANDTSLNTDNSFIYIDNSFSMDAVSEKGRLLDIAKQKAIDIVNNLDPRNNFWIITNDFHSIENIPKNQKEAEQYILSINSSSSFRTKKEILNKEESLSIENCTIFMISDFQKNSTKLSNLKESDTSKNIIINYLNNPTNSNISIDSCWIGKPINHIGEKMSLRIKITNHSDNPLKNLLISLEINSNLKTQSNISLLPNETKETELSFILNDNKFNNGIIKINDNSIIFDNTLYFSFKLDEKINVLQIFQENENNYINKVFKSEDIIKYHTENINQLNYEDIRQQELIILNKLENITSGFTNILKEYISEGGSLCIIPPNEANIENYNNFLKTINLDVINKIDTQNVKISFLNEKHPIFYNVFKEEWDNEINFDLPNVNYHYKLKSKNNPIRENILKLENNDAFLNYYQNGRGKIYLFTSPLIEKKNTFFKHSLFVTSFFNMALNSTKTEKLYYIISDEQDIKLPKTKKKKKNIFYLKSENLDIVIPENNPGTLSLKDQIKEANHYNLLQENEILTTTSFNYSRKTSKTEQLGIKDIENYITENNLKDKIKIFNENITIKNNIENLNKSKEYWKYLIILSLLFILIEILLIKRLIS